jgi:hypothetical protein
VKNAETDKSFNELKARGLNMRTFTYTAFAAIILMVGACASANQQGTQTAIGGAFGLTSQQVVSTLQQVSPVQGTQATINPSQLSSGQPFIVQFATAGCSSCQTDARVLAQSNVPVFIVLGDPPGILNPDLLGKFSSISLGSQGSMSLFTDNGKQVNSTLTRPATDLWANHLFVVCNRSSSCKLVTENPQSAAQIGVNAEAMNAQTMIQFANSN